MHSSGILFVLNNVFNLYFLLCSFVWVYPRMAMEYTISCQRIQDEENKEDWDEKICKPKDMVLVFNEHIPEIWWSRYRARRRYMAKQYGVSAVSSFPFKCYYMICIQEYWSKINFWTYSQLLRGRRSHKIMWL